MSFLYYLLTKKQHFLDTFWILCGLKCFIFNNKQSSCYFEVCFRTEILALRIPYCSVVLKRAVSKSNGHFLKLETSWFWTTRISKNTLVAANSKIVGTSSWTTSFYRGRRKYVHHFSCISTDEHTSTLSSQSSAIRQCWVYLSFVVDLDHLPVIVTLKVRLKCHRLQPVRTFCRNLAHFQDQQVRQVCCKCINSPTKMMRWDDGLNSHWELVQV